MPIELLLPSTSFSFFVFYETASRAIYQWVRDMVDYVSSRTGRSVGLFVVSAPLAWQLFGMR